MDSLKGRLKTINEKPVLTTVKTGFFTDKGSRYLSIGASNKKEAQALGSLSFG
ncbi:hypothetical protein J26TS2_38300 [Shouchella clausii]|nr:hypothetical protein J26TS2_38300 [Shouchella clausii]